MSNSNDNQQDPSPCYVVVARHGERLDYVRRDAGDPWTFHAAKPYDPPLTTHGMEQANKLGKHLRQELKRLGISPISAIYSSPFLRCRQTSVAAAEGLAAVDNNDEDSTIQPLVRVEYGLSESFNEQWYRSWALPGADGTWGFRLKQEPADPETLHPWSKQPIQQLPLFSDWKTDNETPLIDLSYESQTAILNPYTFHPENMETRDQQCARMKATVDCTATRNATVMLTSHGAPVTHLFEALTKKSWQEHGRSVYCCYSIYKSLPDGSWQAVVVNESRFLDENLQGDNYVGEETK